MYARALGRRETKESELSKAELLEEAESAMRMREVVWPLTGLTGLTDPSDA